MDFFGKNNDSARRSFSERALYKEYAFSNIGGRLDLSDFLYGSPLYGRIDNKGYSIYPNQNYLKSYDTEDENFGLDFVVDAFNAFYKSFVIEAAERGLTNTVRTRLLSLFPKNCFVNLEDEYYEYQEEMFKQFFNILSENIVFRKKICDFKSFLKSYFWFLGMLVDLMPITKPSFAISSYCSPNISGLLIDLEDKFGADEDELKKIKFLDDPLFDAYVTHAAQYGFSVDKNMPYRLVARINSSEMKFFMSINDSTRETFFEKYYLKTHVDAYNDFKQTSLQMYNSFIEAFPSDVHTRIYKDKLVVKTKDRYYANHEDIKEMGEIYWLKKYFHIRFRERFGSNKKKKLKIEMKKLIKRYRNTGLEKSLLHIKKCSIHIQL